jgi:hypothetical protein
MLSVLNKRWLSQGWRAMEDADAEPMALIFIEKLDEERIPYQIYGELFSRSVKLRARRMEQGLNCDDFSVDMMLACWPTLRKEIREKEIAAKNLLPETAESQCRRCMGLGKEYVYNAEGKLLGVKQSCEHLPLIEGEWLFGQAEKESSVDPIEIKPSDAVSEVLESKRPKVKPAQDDGTELLSWCYETVKQSVIDYQRYECEPMSPQEKRINRHWTRDELYAAALSLHRAIEYIRIGPRAFARAKNTE